MGCVLCVVHCVAYDCDDASESEVRLRRLRRCGSRRVGGCRDKLPPMSAHHHHTIIIIAMMVMLMCRDGDDGQGSDYDDADGAVKAVV